MFTPNVLLCQESPLVIEPGEDHRSKLVAGLVRSVNFHPYFRPGEVSGTYRLVWGVFAEKDGRDLSGLLPLEERRSNTFTITNS